MSDENNKVNKKDINVNCIFIISFFGVAFSLLFTTFLVCIIASNLLHVPLGFGFKYPTNGCKINVSSLSATHSLILKLKENEFIYPDKDGLIHFQHKQRIRLACPGNNFTVANHLREIEAQCIDGYKFAVPALKVLKSFESLNCTNNPQADARKTGNQCLGNLTTEIEVGFNISNGFVRTYQTCFNETTKDSLYSTFKLKSTIGYSQKNTTRPKTWIQNMFYSDIPHPLYELYSEKYQKSALSFTLKANSFINFKTNSKLSRGHLTANADFIYNSQRQATFFYVNSAPQWYTINSGNWNTLEMYVRQYAIQNSTDLIIYTGTWGTSTLPNSKKQNAKLYLYPYNTSKPMLTIPELFWKILYKKDTKQGIAFVTHNNPYDTNAANKTICKDICGNKIKFENWLPQNITLGYSYCCSINDFRKNVTSTPRITVIKDLLI